MTSKNAYKRWNFNIYKAFVFVCTKTQKTWRARKSCKKCQITIVFVLTNTHSFSENHPSFCVYNNSIFFKLYSFCVYKYYPYFSFCVYNYSTFFSQFLYKYSPLIKTFVLLIWLFSQHSFRVWYSSSLSLIWTLLYFAPSFFGLPIQFSSLQFVRTRTEAYQSVPIRKCIKLKGPRRFLVKILSI